MIEDEYVPLDSTKLAVRLEVFVTFSVPTVTLQTWPVGKPVTVNVTGHAVWANETSTVALACEMMTVPPSGVAVHPVSAVENV